MSGTGAAHGAAPRRSLLPLANNRVTERLTAFDGVSFAKKRARVRSQFFGQLIALDCV
jgi:hypothetical protein